MHTKKHVISGVKPDSIAMELELEPGDELISINGKEIEDVFDYQFLTEDEYLLVVVRKNNGEEWELEIEKDYDEDLGIEFENGLMDDYKSCSNKCMFCFIDQMPPGMRETLYFKDDDSRLSFLQGNYVTLTNMKDKDIERIIYYNLGPINVSVHTTNPKLRCTMLHNRFAGEALKKIKRLSDAGIEMNGQVVLCKGVNDGEELERTIRDLTEYIPNMQSLSIVPVGLTKYREGLYPLEAFEKEDAGKVLEQIHRWQDYCMEHFGTHFVHGGDEWYLLAEEPVPEEPAPEEVPTEAVAANFNLDEQEYQVLLRIVEAEAGGEDTVGKMLVANVIMNRVNSGIFPATVTGVVYQNTECGAQFAPTVDGRIDRVSVSQDTTEAVNRVLGGEDVSQGALFFRSTRSRSSWFDQSLNRVLEHGNHIFYTL